MPKEIVNCPNCSVSYALVPERVRTGIRLARCFKCGHDFDIEPEVLRLLGARPPSAVTVELPADFETRGDEAVPQQPPSPDPQPALAAEDAAAPEAAGGATVGTIEGTVAAVADSAGNQGAQDVELDLDIEPELSTHAELELPDLPQSDHRDLLTIAPSEQDLAFVSTADLIGDDIELGPAPDGDDILASATAPGQELSAAAAGFSEPTGEDIELAPAPADGDDMLDSAPDPGQELSAAAAGFSEPTGEDIELAPAPADGQDMLALEQGPPSDIEEFGELAGDAIELAPPPSEGDVGTDFFETAPGAEQQPIGPADAAAEQDDGEDAPFLDSVPVSVEPVPPYSDDFEQQRIEGDTDGQAKDGPLTIDGGPWQMPAGEFGAPLADDGLLLPPPTASDAPQAISGDLGDLGDSGGPSIEAPPSLSPIDDPVDVTAELESDPTEAQTAYVPETTDNAASSGAGPAHLEEVQSSMEREDSAPEAQPLPPAEGAAPESSLPEPDPQPDIEPAPSTPIKNVAMAGGTVRLSPQEILAAMASSMSMAKAPQQVEAPAGSPEEKGFYEEDLAERVAPPPSDGADAGAPEAEAPDMEAAETETLEAQRNDDDDAAAEAGREEQDEQAEQAPQVDQGSLDTLKPTASDGPAGQDELPTNEAARLKIREAEDTIMDNLSMADLIALAEAGKLQEHYQVARQFSNNWIEAPKIPALRPVFSRLREEQEPPVPATPLPPPPTMEAPAKRGLLSSLFGRK